MAAPFSLTTPSGMAALNAEVTRQAINLSTHETLCAHNPHGAKGCGEAGTIGAPAAIMNAVVNALAPPSV